MAPGAVLAAWTKLADNAKEHARIRQTLQHWQQDVDLAGIRGPDAVATLAADEQGACKQQWADVAAVLLSVLPRKWSPLLFAVLVAAGTLAEKEERFMKRASATEPAFPPYLTRDEQRKHDDYEWALHDLELRKKFGGKIVVVHRMKVLGVGRSYQAAWVAAQRRRNCPAKHEVAMVVVPCLVPEDAAGRI